MLATAGAIMVGACTINDVGLPGAVTPGSVDAGTPPAGRDARETADVVSPGSDAQVATCVEPSACPGADEPCRRRTCTQGRCGWEPVPQGTKKPVQTSGDCKVIVCDGRGGEREQADETDVPDDGNACTAASCKGGAASTPEPAGTACGDGRSCDGAGHCGTCNQDAQCPGAVEACRRPSCTKDGVCDFAYVTPGTRVSSGTAGDCLREECGQQGRVMQIADPADVPDDGNPCTVDVCNNGVGSHTPAPARTVCASGFCDGSGHCVTCVVDADCKPTGEETECRVRACIDGTCALRSLDATATLPNQVSGDCKRRTCGSDGAVVSAPDVTDNSDDGNPCTADTCDPAGAPVHTPSALGTACTMGAGSRCDGQGACVPSFGVVRVGDGIAVPAGTAAPVFIEERLSTAGAAVVRTVALPTAPAGTNRAFSLSSSATAEGQLSRSADGKWLTLAGYSAPPGNGSVQASTAALVPRVVARVAADGTVNTTTAAGGAFSADSPRTAVSLDGSAFWVGGEGSGSTGGVFYVGLGAAVSSAVLLDLPSAVRACDIAFGQLYCSSGKAGWRVVFAVGAGTPTPGMGAPVAGGTGLPGLVGDADASPHGFVFFDREPAIAGPDLLYVADDRALAAGGGVQKWSRGSTGMWSLSTTIKTGLTSGTRSVTGWTTAQGITLVVSTSDGKLVRLDDTGAVVAGSSLATAAGATAWRGVALWPR